MSHYGFTDYPHPGGCEDCRRERVCNFCGESFGEQAWFHAYCTNGRCMGCHQQECTSGGDTSPGHGFGPRTP